jgi:hypothetical protein
MRPRIKGALLLLLAFGLGAVGGAVGLGAYQARFGEWRSARGAVRFQERIVARLSKELDLRSEQRDKVEAILKDAGQEFTRLRDEIGPRFRDIRDRTRDRIRAALDAAQQVKFDTVAKEWERRSERWRWRAPEDSDVRKGP